MNITAVETIHPARTSPPFIFVQVHTDEVLSRLDAAVQRSTAP